jgi:AbrB family looped-hinge helix DNA binding protein
MSKVTSNYQVTIPKAIANRYGIRPCDNLEWIPTGDVIRVVSNREKLATDGVKERLRLFDEATERRRQRERNIRPRATAPADRGWSREVLYRRGRSR